jgi:hypothetical protein
MGTQYPLCVYVCVLIQLVNKMTDVNEVWRESCATGGHPNHVRTNFLKELQAASRIHKTVKWLQH